MEIKFLGLGNIVQEDMRLGYATNGRSCELHMQKKFCEWLKDRGLIFIDELHIKKFNRIPDFLVIKTGHLINIEAKSNPSQLLIRQLDDNATYADYSFAFIPDFCLTPIWFKKALSKRGYGLIIYNYKNDVITEVLEAHFNKSRDIHFKKRIIATVHHEIKLRNSKAVKHTQLTI